jgi:hypothetical protein
MHKLIHEAIKNELIKRGYDGLAGPDCGCGVDDLMPNDCLGDECVPAILVKNAYCKLCKIESCSNYGCDEHIDRCYQEAPF